MRASALGNTLTLRMPRSTACWRMERVRSSSGAPASTSGGRGLVVLQGLLRGRPPWAAAEIEPGDRQRIIRALELLDAGELDPPDGESELWTDATRPPTLLGGLVLEREELYARIDARVDAMIGAGAEAEVRRANAAGA